MNSDLQSEIAKGANLKHSETLDKSAPQIPEDVHVKKVDRGAFLEEVAQPHQLKRTQTIDKSAPQVSEGVHVKKVDRAAFLQEIEKSGKCT